jgi:hypothetical protein
MQGKVLNQSVLTGWEKRQPKREDASNERTKAYRERMALKSDAVKRAVTQCDDTKREVTLETETETETEKKKPLSSSDDDEGANPSIRLIPVKAILAAYHEHCPMMPVVRKMTEPRKRKLKARWLDDPECQTVEYWNKFFAYVAQSDFLTGRGREPWIGCDFEWLIEAGNHVKVIEGKYENRSVA